MPGRRQLAMLLIGLLLAGCAVGPVPRSRISDDEVPRLRTPARGAAERGVAALTDGNPTRASQLFNEALSRDPENAKLHLLNGLAHHAAYLGGARGRSQLAETAYRVALAHDPGNWRAAYQLGLLYVDMRQHAAAQAHLAEAAGLAEDNADVHYALAVASYYERDLTLALWAIRRAVELEPDRSLFVHGAAMVAGAAGVEDEAQRHLARYRALEPDRGRAGHLARRLGQWKRVHERIARSEDRPLLAQATPAPGPGAPPTAEPPTGAPAARVPVAPNWSDCVQALTPATGPSGAPTSGASGTTADETTALPALPSPCVGLPLPRMALVDVTLVRTEELRTTRQGVNLLESLAVVLTGSQDRKRETVGTVTTLTKTFTTGVALATAGAAAGAAGITYALNIANAGDNRVEVIARPTLIALDRTPSNFFSGSNVTIAVAGQFGGGSIQEKPVGVSLSVTPTFVDDDTMLLSVKATRSFFEAIERGNFDQSVSTTRNMVTANVMMKFGQTLIISGMVERDVQDGDSGVPLLRDLPVVQYFFGRRDTLDFRKEVIAILTPRRATFLPDALRSVEEYLSRPDLVSSGRHDLDHVRAQARRAVTGVTPHVTAIIASLADNVFFHEFRTGDLAPPRIHGGPNFRRILKEILELLYF